METHRTSAALFGAGGEHLELLVQHRVALKKGTCKEEDRRGRREVLDLTMEVPSGDRPTITRGDTMLEGLLEGCGEGSREEEVRETIHVCTRSRIAKSVLWCQAFYPRLDSVALTQRRARYFRFFRATAVGTCVDGTLGLFLSTLQSPRCPTIRGLYK